MSNDLFKEAAPVYGMVICRFTQGGGMCDY